MRICSRRYALFRLRDVHLVLSKLTEHHMKQILFFLLSVLTLAGKAQPSSQDVTIQLPAGFSSTVVAKNLGRARHIAVNSNGDIYVKLERLKAGKGIIWLRDKNGDGRI